MVRVTWWLILGWAAAAAFDTVWYHLGFPMSTFLIGELGWYLAIFVFMACLACRAFGASLTDLLPVQRVSARLIAPVLAITVGVMVLEIPLVVFLSGVLPHSPSAGEADPAWTLWLPAQYVASAMLPAIFEELIFRGIMLQSMLAMDMSKQRAIVFSAFLFATVHFDLVGLPGRFLFGVAVGWMFVRTESLLPGMVMHAANNAIVVYLSRSLPSDASVPDWLRIDLHPMLAVLIVVAGAVLAVVGVIGFRRVHAGSLKPPAAHVATSEVFDLAA